MKLWNILETLKGIQPFSTEKKEILSTSLCSNELLLLSYFNHYSIFIFWCYLVQVFLVKAATSETTFVRQRLFETWMGSTWEWGQWPPKKGFTMKTPHMPNINNCCSGVHSFISHLYKRYKAQIFRKSCSCRNSSFLKFILICKTWHWVNVRKKCL